MAAVALVFVLVHGNNGAAGDWDPLLAVAKQTPLGQRKDVFFFASQANEGRRTLVGVDTVADRMVDEVHAFFQTEAVAGFDRLLVYMVSHSLGGLITRCSLPALLRKEPRVELLGYLSMATPHLGVGRPGGSVMKNAWKFLTESACENMYNQTGLDLLFKHDSLPNNLLARLADPDGPYLPLLHRFRHRTLVSAPFLDMLVPYSTAAVSPFHPYDENEERITDQPCCVWGYSGFDDSYDALLATAARGDAKGRPEDARKGALDLTGDWEGDRHRFVMWRKSVMEQLRQVSFRRLDVSIVAPTRWSVHDAFLKKKLRGIFPDSGAAGDQFLALLWSVLSKDVQGCLAE